jgi:hypothetical protein
MSLIEKLKPLCGEHSEMLREPSTLDAAGRRWLLACDGRALVAVPCGDESAPEADARMKGIATEWIERATAGLEVMAWPPLRDFMRYAPRAVSVCEDCDGSGEHECPDCDEPHDCGHCGGEGHVLRHTPEPVTLFGSPNVDRRIFSRFADGLEAEHVRYAHGGAIDPVLFADESGAWVLVVMPTTDAPVATFEVSP